MTTSKLKLNPDKTEFGVFSSKRQRDKLKAYFPTTILGSPLWTAELVKNLGVWFGSDFSWSKHAQNICKSCFVAHALVSSRLDYCNSLFRSLSSIFVNYSASKIVQLELYQIPVDTLI